MSTKRMHWSTLTIAALILAAPLATSALAQEPSAAPIQAENQLDFDAASADLQAMRDLFGGGSGKPVTFDAAAAEARGLSPQSIQLAKELADYTNALMTATGAALAKSVDVTKLDVDIQKYPLLAFYLDEATRNAQELAAQEEPPADEPAPGERVEPNSWLSEYICGAFWRPRPSRAAPWITWYFSNPGGVLSGWGYHTTPGFAGGGYTRAQTYSWALCGFGTFRDHAYILSAYSFREQTYAGWTPRGEPNPEVWRTGPWPYPAWPVYVRWWHATH